MKEIIHKLTSDGRLAEERESFQHGDTTVLQHSIHVAEVSRKLSRKLKIKVDEPAMIRGALLHDYFLYDWHEKDKSHSFHGFRHPTFAVKNAKEDFDISKKEENIISRHMFPLTLKPPTCKEAWIVCIADKYCALVETVGGHRRGKK